MHSHTNADYKVDLSNCVSRCHEDLPDYTGDFFYLHCWLLVTLWHLRVASDEHSCLNFASQNCSWNAHKGCNVGAKDSSSTSNRLVGNVTFEWHAIWTLDDSDSTIIREQRRHDRQAHPQFISCAVENLQCMICTNLIAKSGALYNATFLCPS